MCRRPGRRARRSARCRVPARGRQADQYRVHGRQLAEAAGLRSGPRGNGGGIAGGTLRYASPEAEPEGGEEPMRPSQLSGERPRRRLRGRRPARPRRGEHGRREGDHRRWQYGTRRLVVGGDTAATYALGHLFGIGGGEGSSPDHPVEDHGQRPDVVGLLGRMAAPRAAVCAVRPPPARGHRPRFAPPSRTMRNFFRPHRSVSTAHPSLDGWKRGFGAREAMPATA